MTPYTKGMLFTPEQLALALEKKKRDKNWTNERLARYLDASERQLYRWLDMSALVRSHSTRRLLVRRLGIKQ